MKKKTKKKVKKGLVPLGCLRVQVSEEPISPPMEDGPADLSAELDSVLDDARQTLNHYGECPAVAILFTVSKKLFLILNVTNDNDKITAKATVRAWVKKHRAKAAILVTEVWIRPSGSISREDPRREEALVAVAKSRCGHFMAVQRFHRLSDGQFFFEKPSVLDLQKNSWRDDDSWLGNIHF